MLPKLSASEIATGKWEFILPALGVEDRFLSGKHCPCPMCGGKDRFRFDNKQGRGTWICTHCGAGDGYALLQGIHGWMFKEAAREVEQIAGFGEAKQVQKQSDDAKKMATIKRTWDAALPVAKGDPVWKYLNKRVGLEIVPASLRHHPALSYIDDDGEITYHPALVAIITYPDGKAAGMHRIYLTSDGNKAPVDKPKKLMPGRPLQTASVKLGAVSETVGISEGIETALAASMRFSVPVWSCISTSGLESWKPSEGIKRVIVFGDNDKSFAGQASAYAIAKKLANDGLSVEVRIPETAGTDWADGVTP